MLIMRRWVTLTLLGVSLASVLLLGVGGYRLFAAGPSAPEQMLYRGETLLFVSVILSGVLLVAYLAAVLRSRSLSRRLDRLIEVTGRGGSGWLDDLDGMGPLGRKIRTLYARLNQLNELKSLKISTLSRLNRFLIENIDLPLVVADASGRIESASRRRPKRDGAEERDLQDLFPGRSFAETVFRLREERRPLEMEDGATLYPVFNRDGQLANILCIWGRESVSMEGLRGTEAAPESRPAESRVVRWMRTMFAPRRDVR